MSLSGGSAVSDLVVTGIRPLTTESDWVADNDNEISITSPPPGGGEECPRSCWVQFSLSEVAAGGH